MTDTTDTAAATTDADTTDTTAGNGDGKTFTQDEVNNLIAREKGQIQRKYEGYDELKAKADKFDELEHASKSDLEKVAGERDTLKGELEPTRAENLRLRVAIDKKLPAELVDRLRGSTKEEIEADADELMKLVEPANGTARPGGHDGGPRGQSAGTPQDMDSMIRRAAGR